MDLMLGLKQSDNVGYLPRKTNENLTSPHRTGKEGPYRLQ